MRVEADDPEPGSFRSQHLKPETIRMSEYHED